MKGNVLELQNRTKEAQDNYRQALQNNPDNDFAANNLAYLLAEDGRDLQSALNWAQAVRKRHPDDPHAADTLGWVYYKLGRLIQAREQGVFAVSKEPDNGVMQYHLGVIYKANNERDLAEKALKKAAASANFKDKGLAEEALKEIYRWRSLVKP